VTSVARFWHSGATHALRLRPILYGRTRHHQDRTIMPSLPRTLLISASISVLAAATPALAQKTVEGRVDKLEKEMQAVQRKVFPGGAGQIVAPDVTPEAPPVQQTGSPASSPLADLTSRVSAIETQVARLTGQTEENDHRLRLLEDANAKLTTQVQVLQTQAAAAAAAAQAAADPTPPPQPFVAPSGPPPKAPVATAGKASPSSTPAKAPPAAAKPSAAATQARMDAVAAIEKPSSGNAALDGYTYGYRLWMAKFYPEAETQLEDTLGKYPNDPTASRTGNLLGRAYLDDAKPTQAAKVLFDNYRNRPKGDRAAESLAWVAEALIRLDHPKDACKAYDEIKDSFGEAVPANVKDMVAKGRVTAKCGA
jgi:TolA-binding protein